VLVVLVFAATRLAAGWVADHPTIYGREGSVADPTSDVANYIVWANQMQDFGHWPYREFGLEYPPGALPIANLPYWLDPFDYRVEFIALNVAFDALALVALHRLARRTGSWWGVAAWLALVPALGPVAYTRLDMPAAACIAWALYLVATRRWTGAGVWLGLGIAIKLTPGLLVPALAVAAPKPARVVAAAGGVVAMALAPFLFDLPELYDHVAGYHLDRGVHGESIYGNAVMIARTWFDADIEVVSAFGAFDVEPGAVEGLKTLSNIAAIGVLIDSVLTARYRARRGDGHHLVVVVASASILLAAVGRVFSPQYLVWLLAGMAAGLAVAPRLLRWPAVLLAGSVVASHVFYPSMFFGYWALEGQAVVVATLRSLLLLAAGLLAVRAAWRYRPSGTVPAVEEHEGVEPALADVLVRPDR